MYILVFYLVPGVVLGSLVPTEHSDAWPQLIIVPIVYSIVIMVYELIKGKKRVCALRQQLSQELDIEPGSELMDAAINRACLNRQIIYKFHFTAFVVGCLTLAIPVFLLSTLIFLVRIWLK